MLLFFPLICLTLQTQFDTMENVPQAKTRNCPVFEFFLSIKRGMGRIAYVSDRGCRQNGFRSHTAGGVRFALSAAIPAADLGAVVLLRAKFLKETLSGGFGNSDDEVSVMERFFCVDDGADLFGESAAILSEGSAGDGFHRPIDPICMFTTDKL